MGGGNTHRRLYSAPSRGLSPRGRGKLFVQQAPADSLGSIPAWAGETLLAAAALESGAVYPRVGGGNRPRLLRLARALGLSPRGRGKLDNFGPAIEQYGSIPAWAGETAVALRQDGVHRVYPRVGGGNRPRLLRLARVLGLSPRGRGKPSCESSSRQSRRSIPAWAGETTLTDEQWAAVRVYPRVGGGNILGSPQE